jgi:hypothetical protein
MDTPTPQLPPIKGFRTLSIWLIAALTCAVLAAALTGKFDAMGSALAERMKPANDQCMKRANEIITRLDDLTSRLGTATNPAPTTTPKRSP